MTTHTALKPVWTEVAREEELQDGKLLTIKTGNHQLVLGRSDEAGLFALDNRCPHEGYPLASGDLEGCRLTCAWHNWKFDVTDGACLIGGEGVRAYPVRARDGAIEVDLSDPDPAEARAKLLASLEEGLFRFDNGRTFRDAARLLESGYPVEALAADLAAFDGRRAEYGTTHVLPVAADVLRIAERYPGSQALFALAPALDLAGETDQRLPEHPWAPVVACPRERVGAELRAAVEAEDAERAEGLLLGALDDGATRAEVERWLYAAVSDHFLSFGHPLIYLVKSRELFDRAGDARLREVSVGQLRGIVFATREDTLPYMKAYADRLAEIEDELPAVFEKATGTASVDAARVRDAVLDGTSAEAFDAVWEPLRAGAAPSDLARALVGAAAHRFLRFDDRLDRDPEVAENWIWVTHRFTFASAVHRATERFRSPDALRFLFQAVMFVHSGRAMDRAENERPPIAPTPATAEEVVQAIAARAPELAVDRAAGLLASGAGTDALRVALEDLCLADPLVRPIVVAHAIKTTLAAFEEHVSLGDHPDRDVPILALVRLLASPIVERRVHEQARRSLRWVVEGTMPRKLTQ